MSTPHLFRDIPIVYLAPFGRGGSIFIQGLFDRHPQISVIPCLFPFLDLVNRDPKITITRCCELFRNEIDKKYGCVLDYTKLENTFLDFVAEVEQTTSKISFQELQLRGIHFAWSMHFGVSIKDVKVILWHPHRLDSGYKRFFQSLAKKKILLTCREPLDSLVSTYRHWVDNDWLPMSRIDRSDYVRHPWIILYLNNSLETYNFYKKYREHGCLIAIEALNMNVEVETRRISEFLGVDFMVNLLGQSTCLGLPMQQLPGKLVTPISARSKSHNVVPVNTELLVKQLFGEASTEIGYSDLSRECSVIDSYSLIFWLFFSNVWGLAYLACIEEGRRASQRRGSNHITAFMRAFKYYVQFLKQFLKLIIRLLMYHNRVY